MIQTKCALYLVLCQQDKIKPHLATFISNNEGSFENKVQTTSVAKITKGKELKEIKKSRIVIVEDHLIFQF